MSRDFTSRLLDTITAIDKYQTKHAHISGKVLAILGAIVITLQTFVNRAYSKKINSLQLVHHQMIFQVVAGWFINKALRGDDLFPVDRSRINLLLFRAIFGAIGFPAHLIGTILISPQLFTVLYNSNMIFAIILSIYFMGIMPSWRIACLVVVYILGVVVMVIPGIVGLTTTQTNSDDFRLWTIVFPITSGFCGACITILLMKYSDQISVLQNLFWFAFSGVLVGGLGFSTSKAEPPSEAFSLGEYFLLPLSALMMVGSQSLVAMACRYEKRAAIITPIISSSILLTFFFDVFVMHAAFETVNFVGSLVVFGSLVLIIVNRDMPATVKQANDNIDEKCLDSLSNDMNR